MTLHRPCLVLVLALASACGSGDGGDAADGDSDQHGDNNQVSNDGNWTVQAAIDSCYVFTGTGTIHVSSGTFSASLFTYCAVASSGATRLAGVNGTCGADLKEEVSITGTFSGNDVEGNLALTGGACNGGNGYDGTVQSGSITAASFWGQITFTKQ